jgi:hypothetical protein
MNKEICMVHAVVQLENGEAVRQWINEDLYLTGRVWDKIEILPFKVVDV